MTAQHISSSWIVRGASGAEMLVKPKCGDMQDDGAAPEKFVLAYTPLVTAFVSETETVMEDSAFHVQDPIKLRAANLAYTLYADDLLRFGIIYLAKSAIRKLNLWDVSFDPLLAKAGMGQAYGKRELLFKILRRGAIKQEEHFFSQQNLAFQGVVLKQLRHLGSWYSVDGRHRFELQQRIAATHQAWTSFRGFWSRAGIALHFRVAVFFAIVRMTMLAGLVALPLSDSDVNKNGTYTMQVWPEIALWPS
jgi:hypothetical protein